MFDGVKTWLESARARWTILIVCTLLVVPSAGPHLVFDDHIQALMRSPEPRVPGLPYAPLDLFVFARPGALNDVLIDRGMLLPWWTDRALLIAFFRPLASLTHVVDGWLWPASARMMHLHSVAWFALLLGVVAAVYRRFVTPAWLAGGAFLLYAIDDTHGATVSWIANRNAILATIFGLLTLLSHDTWRQRGGVRPLAIALIWFIVGLLTGEATLGVAAYIASYAIFLDNADRRSRALSLAPYAAVVIGWRVMYQALGYGARGSGSYVDPGREPLAFLARLPMQVAALVQGQFGAFSADLWFFSRPDALPILIGGALLTGGVMVVLLYPLLKTDRTARFWAAGALGAIVPSASSIPGDRLLLLVGVGAMALLAQVFATYAEKMPPFPAFGARRVFIGVLIGGLFVRRVVASPLMLPFRAHSMEGTGRLADFAADTVQQKGDTSRRSVIGLNPPSNVLVSYLGTTLATRGAPVPAHVRWIAPTDSDIAVSRIAERVLSVRPARGFFYGPTDRLYRSERNRLRAGDRIELEDMTIVIGPLTPRGDPAEVDFEFRERLESPRYLFLRWDGEKCKATMPPRVGETVVYPATDFVKMLFDNVMGSLF